VTENDWIAVPMTRERALQIASMSWEQLYDAAGGTGNRDAMLDICHAALRQLAKTDHPDTQEHP